MPEKEKSIFEEKPAEKNWLFGAVWARAEWGERERKKEGRRKYVEQVAATPFRNRSELEQSRHFTFWFIFRESEGDGE